MSSLYGDLEHDNMLKRAAEAPKVDRAFGEAQTASVNKSKLLVPCNVIRKKPQNASSSNWIQSNMPTGLSIRDDDQDQQNRDGAWTTQRLADHNYTHESKRTASNANFSGASAYDPFKPNEYEVVVKNLRKRVRVRGARGRNDYECENSSPELSPKPQNSSEIRLPSPEPACSKENPYMPVVHESRRMLIGKSDQKPEPRPADSPKQNPQGRSRSFKVSPSKGHSLSTSTVLSGAPVVYQVPKIVAPSPAMVEMSEVIVLTNMVTPDDIDSNLRQEITEGCIVYGKVLKCVIHKTETPASEEESVKIFVQFPDKASATRAITGLNKRFFGGRVVLASFFSKEKFLSKNFD